MSALSHAIGLDALAELSRIIGGRRLYVPLFITTGQGSGRAKAARDRLVALVGPDLAADLITYFGGSYVYVPKGASRPPLPWGTVDRKAVRRMSRTLSADTIALRLGCSIATVYRARGPQSSSRPHRGIRKERP